MRSATDKPFLRICGRESIYYTLKALEASPLISEVIIASAPKNIVRFKGLIRKYNFSKTKKIIRGGNKRADSVYNALCGVSTDTAIVLVHDAVRPFLTQTLLKRAIGAARKYGASLAAVPVKPTIKESGNKGFFVKKTLDRRVL